jgi:DNA-binding NtrC family response regulator
MRLPFLDLELLRQAAVKQALRTTKGHKGHAARLLGVHINTMSRLAARFQRSPDPVEPPPCDPGE